MIEPRKMFAVVLGDAIERVVALRGEAAALIRSAQLDNAARVVPVLVTERPDEDDTDDGDA
jgi:hypothetical protein